MCGSSLRVLRKRVECGVVVLRRDCSCGHWYLCSGWTRHGPLAKLSKETGELLQYFNGVIGGQLDVRML
eukprot:252269-Amphidinium_carterae.1